MTNTTPKTSINSTKADTNSITSNSLVSVLDLALMSSYNMRGIKRVKHIDSILARHGALSDRPHLRRKRSQFVSEIIRLSTINQYGYEQAYGIA